MVPRSAATRDRVPAFAGPPDREADRLESLRSYRILDTPPESVYDDVTLLAARTCQARLAAVALLDADRVWFKARLGLPVAQIPRGGSLVARTVQAEAPLTVPDALGGLPHGPGLPHDRGLPHDPGGCCDDELVAGSCGARSFAGVPLIGRDGLPLGALCVLDRAPRHFSRQQLDRLQELAAHVVTLLEARRSDQVIRRDVADAPDGGLTAPRRLRRALDDGEFVPHLQPVVDLATGRPVALEALLRWDHPERGLLLPGRFLPAIESSGMIKPLGRHVVRESLRAFRALPVAGRGSLLGLAVNVSPAQLCEAGFAATVLRELAEHRLPGRVLTLELTETMDLLDDAVARSEIAALHAAGVQLSIDDYPIGYSSLLRLLDLPVSVLKLDRSLTGRLPEDPRATAVVRSTIEMATELGLTVIGEGIERPEQHRALHRLGCHQGQGFLFGAAMTPDVLTEALESWTPRTPQRAGARAAVPAPRWGGRPAPAAVPPVDAGTAGTAGAAATAATARGERPEGHGNWAHVLGCQESRAALAQVVADRLEPALTGPGAAVVLAVPASRRAVRRALAGRGLDLRRLTAERRFVQLDAPALLKALLVGEQPCPERLDLVLRPLLATLGERHGAVRMYGELTACLWDDGRADVAAGLEGLAHDLTGREDVALFMAHPCQLQALGHRPRRAPDSPAAPARPQRPAAPPRGGGIDEEPLYLVDRDRRIAFWNPAAEALTGFPAAEVVGRPCHEGVLDHVDDEGRPLCGDHCPLLATMQDGRPRRALVSLHHRAGHLVPVTVRATALLDWRGAVIGAAETFHARPVTG